MPKPEGSRTRRAYTPSTVPYLRKLLRKIDKVGVDSVDRATLCRIMAKSLGVTIPRMQAVSVTQFKDEAGVINLSLEGESIVIPAELLAVARAYMEQLGKP